MRDTLTKTREGCKRRSVCFFSKVSALRLRFGHIQQQVLIYRYFQIIFAQESFFEK
jgi:hypothetical protein